ncbi:hypothetical protein AHF37_04049 [Paragonimus kellicotti]|nr:hypothetical protein AHF37_04049 [Paragonimus kellicotti]
MREPSPFCTLLFGRDAQMTEVKQHTQSPTWESVHHFLVGDPYVDTLQIVVRDSRTETLLGNCSVPVKLLLTQQQLSVSRPFPLQESGPDGANIYLHLELKALVPGTKKSTSKTDGIVQSEANSAEEPKDIVLGKEANNVSTNPEISIPDMEIRNRATKNANAGDSGMDTTWPRVPTPEADANPSPIVATDDDDDKASIVSEHQNLDSHASPNNPLGRLRLTVEYSITSSLLSVTVHQARCSFIPLTISELELPYACMAIKKSIVMARLCHTGMSEIFEGFGSPWFLWTVYQCVKDAAYLLLAVNDAHTSLK